MPKIMIVDTYYPEALSAMYAATPGMASLPYEAQRDALLGRCFGTADFVSRSLRKLGWEAVDYIYNADPLYKAWCNERPRFSPDGSIAESYNELAPIAVVKPDVLFVQDLSLFTPHVLQGLREHCRVIVGQCSCPWPGDDIFGCYDAIFTSFPHYVERIEACGGHPVFMKLAFEASLAPAEDLFDHGRDIDVSFVGGFGSHWSAVHTDFQALAEAVPTFKWWGYGSEVVREHDAKGYLCRAYQGPAWGINMYKIYARSKVVVNRHGEIALGYGNNLRQYEATGMGAALVTDCVGSLGMPSENFDFLAVEEVVRYRDAVELVRKVKMLLEGAWQSVGALGQKRTLSEHTYDHRAPIIDRVLKELLGA